RLYLGDREVVRTVLDHGVSASGTRAECNEVEADRLEIRPLAATGRLLGRAAVGLAEVETIARLDEKGTAGRRFLRFRTLLWLLFLSVFVVAPSARADFVRALASPDGIDVIAVGDGGQILRSLDGGATWNATTLGTRALTGVAARDHRVLIVGDGGYVWRSYD